LNWTFRKARERLESFKELEQGWDSYGANPISRIAIKHSHWVLDWMKLNNYEAPWVCPGDPHPHSLGRGKHGINFTIVEDGAHKCWHADIDIYKDRMSMTIVECPTNYMNTWRTWSLWGTIREKSLKRFLDRIEKVVRCSLKTSKKIKSFKHKKLTKQNSYVYQVKAFELHTKGWAFSKIADYLGINRRTVSNMVWGEIQNREM